jgi:hypothetical protein
MSENTNLQKVVTDVSKRTEFTEKDLEDLEQYKAEGAPGIHAIPHEVLTKCMELYLEGRSFREISVTLLLKRIQIMYLAQRFNWWDIRQNYIEELQNQIAQRVVDSKLSSQTFMLKLIHNWERRMSKKIDEYQRTNVEPEGGVVDFKEVDKYLKTVEVLHKITAENTGRLNVPASPIGLNVGDGITIEKNGNQLNISPKTKERSVAEMLKAIADAKRQENGE